MESLSKMWKMFSNEGYWRLNNLDETFTSFNSTPLHIAVMSSDTKFATEILSKKPDLALKKDSNGFTPLHLASVRTSLRMVRLLLKANPGACIVQDEDGRTPLHVAAMKNRVEIMKILMEEGLPEAIHLRNDKETILHLCVKSNTKLKTLKLLAGYLVPAQPPYPNSISIDSTDNDDNTILHLAVEMGNTKITNYLLLDNNVRININIENKKGIRALNMLPQAERNDLKFGFYGYHIPYDKYKSKPLSKNSDHEGLKDRINALMVVATLIAGIAFQAAMNPPGGVWQDDSKVNSSTDPVLFAYYLDHMFGPSISGGLDRYVQDNLQIPASIKPGFWSYRPFNRTTGGEKKGVYRLIEYLVKNLRELYVKDIYYLRMTSKSLILEDFLFTDIVSFYNGNAMNTSRGGFFPYLIRYAGNPVLAYTWPNHYVVYMVTNGVAFFASLTIIFLVACGFMVETTVNQVRILVVLMCVSIGCIAAGYLSILIAMLPYFYEGISIFVIFQVFLGVCCMLGVGYFIWTLVWKIVELRKRTRHHHIGVISYYLKALFFSLDAKDAGKLVLFIVGYSGFRINGFIYYGKWSHINRFLY